jgi:hypothetical protein
MKRAVDHGLVEAVVGFLRGSRRGRRGSFGVGRNIMVSGDGVVVEVVVLAGRRR